MAQRQIVLRIVGPTLGFWLGSGVPVVSPVAAFHDAGVGNCGGCHTMHNSQDGSPEVLPATGPFLLKSGTATDVCLSCHASANGSVLTPNPLAPPPEIGAGNFTFLLEDNINDAGGPGDHLVVIGGHRAGHSIVAPSWGLDPDPDLLVAPGGTFPAEEMGCTSCHDPHGNSNFRMLRGAGSISPGGYVFTYAAPEGEGVDVRTGQETPTSHTAYQAGWADWCANCHGFYHENSPGFEHPAEHAMGDEWQTYNAYDGPSNPTGGSSATAYLPEVPLQGAGRTVSGTNGAIGSDRVTCMSCHRAHATSARAALRWDPDVVRLSEDGQRSGSWPIPDPYADPEQRSLCVKCHWDEAADHGLSQPCLACHGGLSPVGDEFFDFGLDPYPGRGPGFLKD